MTMGDNQTTGAATWGWVLSHVQTPPPGYLWFDTPGSVDNNSQSFTARGSRRMEDITGGGKSGMYNGSHIHGCCVAPGYRFRNQTESNADASDRPNQSPIWPLHTPRNKLPDRPSPFIHPHGFLQEIMKGQLGTEGYARRVWKST